MTDRELERRIRRALSAAAPEDLDGVLSRCEARKGTVIPMKKTSGKTARNLIAACLALVLAGGGGGLYYHQANAVTSVVSLDVNPSIELRVNRSEKVVACFPLNEDAALVLADMGGGSDLKGTKLDVAVNAIVGALLRNGYLDSISSAILISVEDRDAGRAARLQQELASAVDGVLQANSSNASVLSQTLTLDAGLDEQAKASSISTGKAALVNQVLALNSQLEFDALAGLSVEELKDLIKTGAPAMPVGKPAARAAAEEYAGTSAVDSVTAEVDSELDEVIPHYEVELRHPTLGEFEYLVDAYTGAVYSGQPGILSGGAAAISSTDAQAAALAHIRASYPELNPGDITVASSRLDTDRNRAEYELTLRCGDYVFEYEVDAYTGHVLDWELDISGVSNGGGGQISLGHASLYITGDAAKRAALEHAGVPESQATVTKLKLDKDDAHPVYDVEFYANGVEYEYEIDALDGSVWQYESEHAGHAPAAGPSADIGDAAAKAAALAHAGVSESQVTKMEVERDYDNGRLEYEVEFKAGGMEYEYTIDGSTGSILEYEKDWDD